MKDRVFLERMASKINRGRVQAGYTQLALSKRLRVSQSTVAYWETGDRAVPLHRIPELCEVLNVTPGYLLNMEDARARERIAFEIATLKADLAEARGEDE